MRKRLLSLALAMALCLGLAAPASAAKDDRSNLPEYEILSTLPDPVLAPDSAPPPLPPSPSQSPPSL